MHFCTKCQNKYYIKLAGEKDDSLLYYCRHCGHEDATLTSSNLCVSRTSFSKSGSNHSHFINAYTSSDPTLPRVTNIPCPNASCATNAENAPREVVYIRYDDENIKYVYLCTTCNTAWKTDEQK